MGNRLSTTLLGLGFCSVMAVLPAQATETRAHTFTMACDGAIKNVVFNITNVGVSTTRFISGGSIVINEPRAGVKFLRLQVAGAITKIAVDMGARQTTSRSDLTFTTIPVATTAGGTAAMQVTGACLGGGLLHGIATTFLL
jgi:hypothetical protein